MSKISSIMNCMLSLRTVEKIVGTVTTKRAIIGRIKQGTSGVLKSSWRFSLMIMKMIKVAQTKELTCLK
jgi:hypothetical protein